MNNFEYVHATSLDELQASLTSEWDEAVILAGGTDLLDRIKDRTTEPERVINIKSIRELHGMSNGSGLSIGPLTTIADLAADDRLKGPYKALAEAAQVIATPQLRNMGTIGGNILQRPRCWYFRCHDTPCLKTGGARCWAHEGRNKYNAIFGGGPSFIVHPSDAAPVLQSLGASVEITGPTGKRAVLLENFFELPAKLLVRENILEANEVLTRIIVPKANPTTRTTYVKFKELESHDFAVVSVAAALTMNGSNVSNARIILGGVAPIPWQAKKAEEALNGKKLDETSIAAAAEAAVHRAQPLDDNEYKIPLTRNLVRRALETLAG